MNRSIFLLIFSLLLISGCQNASFEIPNTEQPIVFISHVKEEKMTFVDIKSNKVLFSDESHYPITDMVSVGNGIVIASSQSEPALLTYNLNSGSISPFITVNQGLTALEYDFSTQSLYVSDVVNDRVHLINIDHNEVASTLEVGTYPTDLEIGDERLFVLNSKSNNITVSNLDLGSTLGTFPVLDRPSGMYFDGENLWVGGHGSYGSLNKSVYAHNPETGEVMKEIEVGLMPIAFFGDTSSPYFYVLCHGDHALYKIDKERNEVVDAIQVGQNPNYVTGNDEKLYVTNLDGDTVSIIDRRSFEHIDYLPVAPGPYVIVLEEQKK